MATFKAEVLPHQKRRDGTFNIKIRVTHNRRKKYLPTQYYVTTEDLTRSLKIKSDNALLEATTEIIQTYRKKCNKLGDKLTAMSVEQVVAAITQESDNNTHIDFVAFANEVIAELTSNKRLGTAKGYQAAINALKRFTKREVITINEITAKFLQDFLAWIETEAQIAGRRKVTRAPSQYLSAIRALHNKAKEQYNDEDLGIIKIPQSPFNKFKIPKPPLTKKRALEAEQIRKIIALPYRQRKGCEPTEYCRFNMAKDVFILSFGLVGMNSVDLYNCTDYKNGYITYQRTKTKTRRQDKAEITIKVQPEIKDIFDKYRDPSGVRVFDFYKHYSNPTTFNANINTPLKEIGKLIDVEDLEFYAARHSWATIALNTAGVDKYTVHTALNHVDESMRVTDIYIKKDFAIIDDANRKVLDITFNAVSKLNQTENN